MRKYVGIKLPNDVRNHWAIDKYFTMLGYRVETIQFIGDPRINHDTREPYGGWRVGLEHTDEEQVLMDTMSGKLSELADKILEFKKGAGLI